MEEIVRIAARGDGVTATGRHVAHAVPGDLVAEDGTITKGANHAVPPCTHFPACGGCQLQHLSDDAFAVYLMERVKGGLTAQEVPVPVIHAPHISPPHSRRRAALRAEKKGRVAIGFNEGGSHKLVDLAECPILHAGLFALIAPLRVLLSTLMRDRKNADVHMTLTDQGVDLLISGVEAEGLAAAEALTAFAQEHNLARLSLDEGYGAMPRWEPEAVSVTLGGVPVPLPEGAFLQATRDGEVALIAAVRRAIGTGGQVADLFAGLGTFTFGMDGPVHAVEGARDAVLALQSAANRSGRAVTSEHRDLFRRPLTAKELARFGAVILDPPRAGAKEQVDELAVSAVPIIAYVSCNPAAFARDAKVLIAGGYTLDWVQPVGQFRWSTHVELAARFSR